MASSPSISPNSASSTSSGSIIFSTDSPVRSAKIPMTRRSTGTVNSIPLLLASLSSKQTIICLRARKQARKRDPIFSLATQPSFCASQSEASTEIPSCRGALGLGKAQTYGVAYARDWRTHGAARRRLSEWSQPKSTRTAARVSLEGEWHLTTRRSSAWRATK